MRDSSQDLRHKILGRKGENATCRYLVRHGYKIVARNYKTPFGEADIVAKRGEYICFVEVKTRESDAFGLPSEAVTREKQQRYRRIAGYYCTTLGYEPPVRFDVASLLGDEIDYFEDAFR